jgi:hypothetical protein
LGLNLIHFAAAVWGVGLRFDPAILPIDLRATWGAAVFWISLAAYGASERPMDLLGPLIVFWTSPVWAGAVAGLSDPIMEYRAYSAVLGWAWIAAVLLPAPIAWCLVLVWAVQSFLRSYHLRSPLKFWGQVLVENGQYGGARAEAAYALAALKEGMFDE